MRRLATSLLFSFGLSPVFASAQVILTSQSTVAAGNPAVAGTTAVGRTAAVAGATALQAQWSKEEDLINGSISKAKLIKMKQVTGTLINFLKDSCLGAAGYTPAWHGEYNSDKNSPGAQLKFGVTCHFAGQNADLSITANDMQPLLDELTVNGQHYLTMRIADGRDKNALYYTDGAGSGGDSAGQTKMWLVTAANGRLPYVPVTRKEYLVEAKAELTSMVKSIEAGWRLKAPVRSAAAQEAERKAVIDQLKSMYSGADLSIRVRVYLSSYKTDEQFLKENIARETAGLQATIHVMDGLMAHMGVAGLAKPAIVSVNAGDFRGFEDGQTNYMLIRMNAAYFNQALSKEVPQLFLVTWHYDGSNATALDLDRQLTERMDGKVLGEMLRK